jgi:dihydropteroate synthase
MTKSNFYGVEVKHFRSIGSIRLRNNLVSMERPQVMGILNITSDSFYSSSRFDSQEGIEAYLNRCKSLGVKFIDVGAQSTRPGFSLVDSDEQIEKLKPVLLFLREKFPEIYVSIDTSCPRVADWALQHGGELINDVEGGRNNPEIWDICAKYNAPYIVMHSRGKAHNLHDATSYQNVTVEVLQELSELIVKIRNAGVKDIIVDPGFGFSKSLEENHELMTNLRFFQLFETPILCGISRKSMIYKKLNKNPETAINGTTALNTYALLNGATFLRVHDPEEASEIIRLLNTE